MCGLTHLNICGGFEVCLAALQFQPRSLALNRPPFFLHSVLDIYCSLTTLPSFSRSFPFSLTLSIPLKSSHVYSHVGVCLSESWDYITQHFILKNRIDNFLHLLKFIFAELIRYFSTLRVFFQLIIF